MIDSVQFLARMDEELKIKVLSQINFYFEQYAPDIWCPYEKVSSISKKQNKQRWGPETEDDKFKRYKMLCDDYLRLQITGKQSSYLK